MHSHLARDIINFLWKLTLLVKVKGVIITKKTRTCSIVANFDWFFL